MRPGLARAMLLVALSGLGNEVPLTIPVEGLSPDTKLPCPVCGETILWKDIEGHLECPKCREKTP